MCTNTITMDRFPKIAKFPGVNGHNSLSFLNRLRMQRLRVHGTTISDVIFVTLTENSFSVTNDAKGPHKYF